jgi:hypothetical protein
MKKFIITMFNDPITNSTSSKRVIGFLGFTVLSVSMLISTYTHIEIAPSVELVEAVKYITIASLFGSTIDKFANKKNG